MDYLVYAYLQTCQDSEAPASKLRNYRCRQGLCSRDEARG